MSFGSIYIISPLIIGHPAEKHKRENGVPAGARHVSGPLIAVPLQELLEQGLDLGKNLILIGQRTLNVMERAVCRTAGLRALHRVRPPPYRRFRRGGDHGRARGPGVVAPAA